MDDGQLKRSTTLRDRVPLSKYAKALEFFFCLLRRHMNGRHQSEMLDYPICQRKFFVISINFDTVEGHGEDGIMILEEGYLPN